MIRRNPAVAEQYLVLCAHNEHFMEYREIVRQQIEAQLAKYHRLSSEEESPVYEKVA